MSDSLKLQALGWQGSPTGSSVSGFTIDDSTEAVAFICQLETGDAITHLGYRQVSRTGTPPTYAYRIEGLDSSGLPDGTALASGTFTPPADATWNGTFQWIALSSSYTGTIGQRVALVIRYSSGTINASNQIAPTVLFSGTQALNAGMPYRATFSAGTWTRVGSSATGPWGYKTASSVFGRPAASQFTTNISTTGNRHAAAITLPTTIGTSFTIAGVHGVFRAAGAASNFRVSLWDAAGTELATTGDLDGDALGTVGSDMSSPFFFTTRPTLSTGTKYFYGIQSVSGSTVGLRGLTMSNADDRKAYPQGENRCLATWNGSAWTEDTLTLPHLELILDDLTVPSGSSGGAIVIGSYGPVVRGF